MGRQPLLNNESTLGKMGCMHALGRKVWAVASETLARAGKERRGTFTEHGVAILSWWAHQPNSLPEAALENGKARRTGEAWTDSPVGRQGGGTSAIWFWHLELGQPVTSIFTQLPRAPANLIRWRSPSP